MPQNDDLSINNPPPTPLNEFERGDYIGIEPTQELSQKTWEYFRGHNADPTKYPPLKAHEALKVTEFRTPLKTKAMKISPKIHTFLAPWYILCGCYHFVILVIDWNKHKKTERKS